MQTPERKKEYARQYYQENRDQLLTVQKKYYQENREQRIAYSKRNQKPYVPERTEVTMFKSARSRASKNNLAFDIEVLDVVIPEFCPILGIPLFCSKGKAGPNSPTLDRIVNDNGYVKGNVCVISHRANNLKNNMTLDIVQKLEEYMRNVRNQLTSETPRERSQ